MANETLITDLVAQEAMQQLEELDRAMEGTLQQFQNCARELAQGLKVPVEVTGDVDALRTLTNTVMRDAQQATQQLTQQLQQQQQVVANTTNTISRQLQAQENLNKAQREAFEQDREAQSMANALLGTRDANYRKLAEYTAEMKRNKEEQKKVNEQEKQGIITQEQAIQKRATLMAAYDKTKIAAQQLSRVLTMENKEAQSAQGSYNQLSQQLERLKMAYKEMNDAEKASDSGKQLEAEIQNLDARLKDLAADMGEHQRNVGNYAIAAQSMKSSLRELTEEIAQLTLQYQEMSDEERRSDIGVQLRDKITQLTEEAGKYKDVISDVKQSISGSASDTRWFDTMIESGKLMVATFGLAKNACLALGMSEESLQKSMLKVQQAMQAVQALQVIQNSLQKQSNLMKGIAVLQSKALAAATALEAKATAQATGATVAQTIAMKAFNAVANANPYVLLATAILGVIGAIVSYTAATEDATAADEAATKAADERKESMESYASSFGNNAGEMLVKYEALRNEWNALGNDINAKRKYLVQHKSDFVAVANAAGMDASSVRDVGSAEKNLIHNTGPVEAAIMRRAKAMAAYAEYVRLTQLKLQELEKASTYSYHVYKSGERVAKSDFAKAGLKMNSEQKEAAKYEGYGGGISSGTTWLSGDQAAKMTEFYRQEARKKAVADMEEIGKKYDGMMDRALHRAGFSSVGAAYAASQGPIEGGGGSRGGGSHGGGSKPSGGKSTGSKSPGGKSAGAKKTGKKTTSSGKTKQEEAKDEKELQEMLLSILIDANKKKTKVVEEYSEEWRKLMKVGLMEQREQELQENKDKYKKDLAELKKSLAQKKITQEEYEKLKYEFEQAYIERAKSIREAYADEVHNVDEEIKKHKEEEAHKELETLEKQHEEQLRLLNQENVEEIQKMRERHQVELTDSRKNLEELEQLKKEHTFELERFELMHAEKVAQKTIENLEKQLELESLNAEDRLELERKLQEAKNTLANATLATREALLEHEVEAEKEAADKAIETEQELMEKRKELFDQWSDKVTEGVNTVAELVGQIYDNQIAKVQELIDAEQKRYEEEVNHIEWLADRGAITTEEAEIRKRDAAERTAKVQEALEKKKKAAEYKKAIVEKANSAAQAAIATALAITRALPNIALAAVVGALGAIQIATILAQPIKAYAEGTKGKPHPGGLAVVGDGNRAEVVMYGHQAWITPDNPTLVDLPRGAEVLPDASKVDLVQMGSSLFMTLPKRKGGSGPIIVNDYEALEGRVANNTKAVTAELRGGFRSMKRELRRQNFRNYINART